MSTGGRPPRQQSLTPAVKEGHAQTSPTTSSSTSTLSQLRRASPGASARRLAAIKAALDEPNTADAEAGVQTDPREDTVFSDSTGDDVDDRLSYTEHDDVFSSVGSDLRGKGRSSMSVVSSMMAFRGRRDDDVDMTVDEDGGEDYSAEMDADLPAAKRARHMKPRERDLSFPSTRGELPNTSSDRHVSPAVSTVSMLPTPPPTTQRLPGHYAGSNSDVFELDNIEREKEKQREMSPLHGRGTHNQNSGPLRTQGMPTQLVSARSALCSRLKLTYVISTGDRD